MAYVTEPTLQEVSTGLGIEMLTLTCNQCGEVRAHTVGEAALGTLHACEDGSFGNFEANRQGVKPVNPLPKAKAALLIASGSTYVHRETLSRMGFRWKSSEKTWQKTCQDEETDVICSRVSEECYGVRVQVQA